MCNIQTAVSPHTLKIVTHVCMNLFTRNSLYYRIHGPTYKNGEWKGRTNREIEELSKGGNIANG
jgi:hypothetical protein